MPSIIPADVSGFGVDIYFEKGAKTYEHASFRPTRLLNSDAFSTSMDGGLIFASSSPFSYNWYNGTYSADKYTLFGKTIYLVPFWVGSETTPNLNPGVQIAGMFDNPNYILAYQMVYGGYWTEKPVEIEIPVHWKSGYQEEPYKANFVIQVTKRD